MKTMKTEKLLLLLLAVVMVFESCEKEENNPHDRHQNKYLVSYKEVGTISANEAKETFSKLLPEVSTENMVNAVKYYTIVYKSTYMKKEVELSGLVLIPTNSTGELKQIQYHHGTLLPIPKEEDDGENYTDAPSLFDFNKNIEEDMFYETRLFGLSFASSGYFVSMPDYAGYGTSYNKLMHFYVCTPPLAQESNDMLMAARELSKELNLNLTNNISLCGWSEGAAVSLYTQKIIEKESQLTVSTNSCLAGPYVPSEYISVVQYIPEDEENPMTFLIAWGTLAHCINQDSPPTTFFNSSIKDFTSFLVSYNQDPTLKGLFNEKTRANKYEDMVKIGISSNAATGWIPKGKVHLFHGIKDEVVPYTQSQSAVKEFEKSSIPKDVVTLLTYPEGDHENIVGEFITETIKLLKK